MKDREGGLGCWETPAGLGRDGGEGHQFFFSTCVLGGAPAFPAWRIGSAFSGARRPSPGVFQVELHGL